MRMSLLKLPIVALFIFIFPPIYANANNHAVIDSGSVKEQIDYVIQKSTTYDEYKVIKTIWVNKIRSNVLDTLKVSKQNLKNSQIELTAKQARIDSLEASLNKTQNNLSQLTREKDSLHLFGILVSKSTYKNTMWGLVIILSILLAVGIVLFKRNNLITQRTSNDLIQIKEEFETHRKYSREREEKTARKHLDEILRYKEKKQAQFR